MPVSFRCEQCGKLLSFESNPGDKVTCPHCEKEMAVPAAVASLPQPKVAPTARRRAEDPPAGGSPPPPPPEEEKLLEEEEEPDAMMAVLAGAMPYVMSLLFHVSLFVIFLLISWLAEPIIRPEEPNPVVRYEKSYDKMAGGVYNPGQSDPDRIQEQLQQTDSSKWSREQSTVSQADSLADTTAELVNPFAGGSGGELARQGLNTGGGELGPPGEFLGQGGNAHHVVFVIDASGSMLGNLEVVKREMVRSISKLDPSQTFHMIFFADELKTEAPPRKLVDAEMPQKREAAEYLDGVRPESKRGSTNPLPALRRAFQVLGNADPRRKGKMIFLLTDGEFDVPREELLSEIKSMNSRNDVAIFTFLYGYESLDPTREDSAESVLQAIAEQNNGEFEHKR